MLVVAELAVQVPHVGIMGIRKCFIGLKGCVFIIGMTGKTLRALRGLGRPCRSMANRAGNTTKQMDVAQGQGSPEDRRFLAFAGLCLMAVSALGPIHLVGLPVGRWKYLSQAVAGCTVPGNCILRPLRFRRCGIERNRKGDGHRPGEEGDPKGDDASLADRF